MHSCDIQADVEGNIGQNLQIQANGSVANLDIFEDEIHDIDFDIVLLEEIAASSTKVSIA